MQRSLVLYHWLKHKKGLV